MLIKAKSIKGYKIIAKDGEIGKVDEFFFDDQHWTVRYLVLDTGKWLTHNEVLISPYALLSVNKDLKQIHVDLSKKQIEESPSWDSDRPVSRRYETSYHNYYGYPAYWSGSLMWGAVPHISKNKDDWNNSNENEISWDPHLYSTKDVTGYSIQAKDGEIGHVDDFIIDDETWAIRYLVIDDSRVWWVGKKILASPLWIEHMDWSDERVYISLARESIRHSPEYSEEVLLNRDYETKLHQHYNREGYWTEESELKNHSF